MLSYLELVNFKSFSKLSFDIRKSYGEPKKMAFIYGENGSGKSNLILSLLFLAESLNTLNNQEKLADFNNEFKKFDIPDEVLDKIIRKQFFCLSDLIKDYRKIDAKDFMSIKIGFRLNGYDGSYYMEFDDSTIIREELRYQISMREGVFFSICDKKISLSPTIFPSVDYTNELKESIVKYWGKHTFLSILNEEFRRKNKKYVKSKLNLNIFTVMEWLKTLSIWHKEYANEKTLLSVPFGFLTKLNEGVVKDKNDIQLKACESALNTFFTQLYTDIKAVYYVFTPANDKYSYELYFRKLIDGKQAEIPVSLESTGTRKLIDIFPVLFSCVYGASAFIDEIDSGIHDLLMQDICIMLQEALNGQFIATTHNTLLLEKLDPENVYIIKLDADGNKTMECIANYKQRTQKNNNIQKKYLRGDYEGVPYSGYLDFMELVDEALREIRPSSIYKE